MRLIDTHCHIDLYDDPAQVVADVMSADIVVVAVTNAPFVFEACRKITAPAPSIHAAIGLHPELVGKYGHQVDDLLSRVRDVRFVGEVGIDYRVTEPDTHEQQREVFGRIVRECAQYPDSVMTIHSRGAEADVVRILEERGESTAILHWYSGGIRHLEHAQGIGCYFSVNPAMLASKNGQKLLGRMARDRVLTETDGPYTKCRGNRATPADVEAVASQLADLWCVEPEEATTIVGENWDRVCALSERM